MTVPITAMAAAVASAAIAAAGDGAVALPPAAVGGWTVIEVAYPSNGASNAWLSAEPALPFVCDAPVAAAPGAKLPQVVRCRATVARIRTTRSLPIVLRMRYALVAGVVGADGEAGVPVTGKQWSSGCVSVASDTCRVVLNAAKVAVAVDPLSAP